MIERETGAPVAKSPMHIASGGPPSAASCFMRVSGIASRRYGRLVEIHTDSHHSYVGGYGLIHNYDPVSKLIRRELSIGVFPTDRTSLRASEPGRPNGANRLIESLGLAERQPMRGADLSFDNLP
jgi:hypothetical protein